MLGQNFFVVVWCIVLYSTLRNRKCANVYTCSSCEMFLEGENHKQQLITVFGFGFCSIVLNLSHQCVRLCCSVCVFEGLCVMSEGKVWFFSESEWF